MKVSIESINPEKAARMLAILHPRQKSRFNDATAELYCRDMIQGKWNAPSLIVISNEGELMDGQHRLHGVTRSGKSIPFIVATEVDREAYKHIDAGRPRSLSFRFGHEKDETSIYNYIQSICRGQSGGHVSRRTTVEELEVIQEFVKRDYETFLEVCPTKASRGITSGPFRTAVLLRLKSHPLRVQEIGDRYEKFLSADFAEIPKVMGGLQKQLTTAKNSKIETFALAWKCFDPGISTTLNRLVMPNIPSLMEEIRDGVLKDLVDVLK
jgi:hypothetical protein